MTQSTILKYYPTSCQACRDRWPYMCVECEKKEMGAPIPMVTKPLTKEIKNDE